MILIGNDERRIDWHSVRAEYIVGGTSYRKLAKKYGIPFGTIRHRAEVEEWVKEREIAEHNVNTITAQKTGKAVAENAVIAARIKEKLLRKLEKEIDALPDSLGSETRNSVFEQSIGRDGKKQREVTKAYKLRDLTAAYRDLTGDLDMNTVGDQVRIVIDV